MATKEESKVRGIWEREPGSGVWWIRYRTADGKLHREKVGRKGDAVDLLNKRRNERRIGTKLPENMRAKGVKFKTLADDIEVYSKANHRDQRSVLGRLKRIRPDFDERIADSITRQEIEEWLTRNTSSPATSNRFRAMFSLVFREAVVNGKVVSNPARLVHQKREGAGHIRFLSNAEEKALRAVIAPAHLPELDISLGTGMRLSEQYGLTWGCVDLVRRVVRLVHTKNNSPRTIPMNATVEAAFRELRSRVAKVQRNDRVFENSPRHWWEGAIRKAGIEDYRWHDNRHTFCSRLAMRGTNLKVIQTLAGHKTLAMTGRYAHLDDASLRVAVDLLPTISDRPNK